MRARERERLDHHHQPGCWLLPSAPAAALTAGPRAPRVRAHHRLRAPPHTHTRAPKIDARHTTTKQFGTLASFVLVSFLLYVVLGLAGVRLADCLAMGAIFAATDSVATLQVA